MKIYLLCLTSAWMMLSGIAHGFDCQPYSVPEDPILEFRVSYFRPQSPEFRKFFGNGGANYQLTGTLPAFSCFCNERLKGLNLWGAVDYFRRNGHSQGFHDKIQMTLIPVTLGAKYFFPAIGRTIPLNFYAAGGIKYYFLRNHNQSEEVRRKVNRRGIGSVIELGTIATISDRFIFDVFVSYSFKTFGSKSYSNASVKYSGLKVSGINIGAGIGYKF